MLVECGSSEGTEYILGLMRVKIRASAENTTTGQHMLLRLEKEEDVTYDSLEQTLVASKC
jgi:S-adenosylhomocysteine hydrolase